MNTSIHHSEEICKRLSENNLLESVKNVSEPYVISIMMSMFQAGYRGKTVYLLACLESERFCFSDGFRLISRILYREQVSFIFDYAANGGDKSALLQKIA